MLDWSFKQSLLWAQVSQLTFYIFVKVGYYSLIALSLHVYISLYCCCVLYMVIHCHCHLNYLT